MKKLKLLVVLAVLALAPIFTGCKTVEQNAYVAGRITARAYLLEKEAGKIKPEMEKALVESYKALSVVCADDQNQFSADLKKLVVDAIVKNVKDKTVKALAIDLVDIYWAQLMAEVNFDKMTYTKAWQVLKQFHKGIEEALQMQKLLEGGGTDNTMTAPGRLGQRVALDVLSGKLQSVPSSSTSRA